MIFMETSGWIVPLREVIAIEMDRTNHTYKIHCSNVLLDCQSAGFVTLPGSDNKWEHLAVLDQYSKSYTDNDWWEKQIKTFARMKAKDVGIDSDDM